MMKPTIIASWVAALLSIVPVGMAQVESCPPTVVVEGHSAIAQELALELTLSGLEQQATPGCPLVRVERREHGEIILAFSDQYGRSAQRSVGSTASAATVVTSWAKQVPIPEASWNTATAVGATTELTPPSAMATKDSSQVPPGGYGGISLLFESALDTHDQRWLGAGIAGCVQLGSVCIGALVRYGNTARRSIDIAELRSKPIILIGGHGFDALAIQRPFRLYFPQKNSHQVTSDTFALQPTSDGLCTEQCFADEDCEAASDSTCVTGFACTVPVVTGPFCCKRMCVCKDELDDLSIPAECDVSNPANTCSNLPGR